MIQVIVNGSAGVRENRDLCARLSTEFGKHAAPVQIEFAHDGEQLCEMARRAIREEGRIITAGGGDGTISAVAGMLAGADKVLGVLPMGTLNHFAKDLKIPLDLENAVRTVVTGRLAEVDVGEVNGRIFINNSSIGLYPEIVRRREKEQQALNLGKWSAFLKATLAVFRRYRFLRVRVRISGVEYARTTPFVFVGNNSYNLDGFGIGGRDRIDRGELCFWLARRTRPLGLLRLGLRAVVGLLRGARDFEAFSGSELEIASAQRRIRVAVDGETMVMDTPLRYRSNPGALRVMVPATAGSG